MVAAGALWLVAALAVVRAYRRMPLVARRQRRVGGTSSQWSTRPLARPAADQGESTGEASWSAAAHLAR